MAAKVTCRRGSLEHKGHTHKLKKHEKNRSGHGGFMLFFHTQLHP